MKLAIRLDMDDAALAPFRDAWNTARIATHGSDCDELATAARAHHAGLDQPAVPAFLRGHIDLIPEIADLLSDRDWQLPADSRQGLAGALAYFTDPADLIPDNHPEFGLLDDAIVIDLALNDSRNEWLAWQEYSALRRGFAGLGPMSRQRWAELRRELPRLLSAQRRGSYVESRFAPADRRSRYRMLDDLPRIDMH
jgi:hypothetical protein